jgi:DNA-binding transcriptional ArsR family regulator
MRTQTEPTRTTLWAMAHPVRFRIFELLCEGPSTASRLGRRLGESRGSVSYHLRMLARAGAIAEDESLGNRRERWWCRPDESVALPTDADVEGRAIAGRMMAMLFARDDDVRRRFATGELSDEWQRGAFFGNWFVELAPDEADELGKQLFALVDEARRRARPADGAAQTLVSVSVLPVLS